MTFLYGLGNLEIKQGGMISRTIYRIVTSEFNSYPVGAGTGETHIISDKWTLTGTKTTFVYYGGYLAKVSDCPSDGNQDGKALGSLRMVWAQGGESSPPSKMDGKALASLHSSKNGKTLTVNSGEPLRYDSQ